jgi:arylsulfatase A-like enzyme
MRRRVVNRELVFRWIGIAVLILWCAACGRPRVETDPPNILLISIDALRADHLSCYGYDRQTSPVLDGLAARGTRFSRAFVNTHGTPPSHATLLSSLYQETHRVGIGSDPLVHTLPTGVEMVQELFSAAGWHTLAVTGGGFMSGDYGFSRGFEVYVDRAGRVARQSEELAKQIRSVLGSGRPVFAFLHTYQVHSPYSPPKRFRRLFGEYESSIEATSEALLEVNSDPGKAFSRRDFEYLEALYDGEIRFTDEVLGDLLASLDAIGFLDNAVVVVTSDHGEEFGEHGGVLHGGKLFEELLRVPLIISGTGIDGGVVEPALVSLVDVAPTLLSLSGLEIPDSMEGQSVFDRPPAQRWLDQRVFSQYGDALYCVRTPRWKLIQRTANQNVKLFDLHRDPRERRNLRARYPDVADELLAELEEWRAGRPRLDLGSRIDVGLSEERVEELRALGYVE